MLTKDNIQNIYPLAPIQETMFFHSLYEQDALTYFEQVSFRQTGELNIGLLERSFNQLLERHDVLRTVFIQKTTDRPLQVILKKRDIDFHFEDISHITDLETCIAAYKEKDRRRSFRLDKDILMRISVLQTGNAEFEIIWSWHHIILDAWCIGILQDEIIEIYNSLLENRPYRLPVAKPYKEYIEWLDKQDRNLTEAYWQSYLAGYSEAVVIPKHVSGKKGVQEIAKVDLKFTPEIFQSLKELASRHHTTLNILLQTIWGILLGKYNQRTDAVFGSVVSGRPAAIEDVESMVGVFINTVPVRISYENTTRFVDLLKRVQLNEIESQSNHYASLAGIFAQTHLKTGLFDHLFLFQNFPVKSQDTPPAAAPVVYDDKLNLSKTGAFESFYYDFNVFAFAGRKLSMTIKFNKNVYEQAFVNAMLDHFRNICLQVIAEPNKQVGTIRLLSPGEEQQLLSQHDLQPGNFSPATDIIYPFEQKTGDCPDAIAIRCGEKIISYRELDQRASAMALHLQSQHGITNGDKVAIMTGRSEMTVIGLLAILKAGAAFVPVDINYPASRKRFILDDSESKLLLTESAFLFGMDEYYTGPLLALDLEIDCSDPGHLSRMVAPTGLAYILYTSGSTGTPKGVEISMQSFSNYLQWSNDFYFDNEPGKTFAFFTPLTFDLTLTSLFTTLLRGDTIYIAPEADINVVLESIFSSAYVNTVKLTPSHISLLQHIPLTRTNVQYVITGGEQLTNEQVNILRNLNKDIRIFNEYGPTEATVGCIVKEIGDNDEMITIGTPIANVYVYILNENRELQPEGLAGELWIGGVALANGYAGNPELTSMKFIDDPFKKRNRIYATGDLGRRLPNGEIEYLGRKDDQVKIRGYRVEPAEIEKSIRAITAADEVVVIARTDKQHTKYLAAYWVGGEETDTIVLRTELIKYLPEYMVPSAYMRLQQLPLTGNGKIDKANLPDPFEALSQHHFKAPDSQVEKELAVIWEDILGRENISVQDSFFDVGGHSLNAVQLVSRIFKQWDVRVELKTVFELETIEKLAAFISRADKTAYEAIQPVDEAAFYELSHAQKRLWIIDQVETNRHTYNIPETYIFRNLHVQEFEKAFQTLVQRHESLRTSFHYAGQEPVQKVHAYDEAFFKIEHLDLRQDEDRYETVKNMADAEASIAFDLSAGPLLRLKLTRVEDDMHICFFTMHHIISDGWSTILLLDEFQVLYNAYRQGLANPLPPLTIHYKDFAYWQNRHITSEAESYWMDALANTTTLVSLPFSTGINTSTQNGDGDIHFFQVDKQMTETCRELAKKNNTTLSNVLLSAYFLLLNQVSDQEDICVGIGHANRDHPDVENIIGFFVNILVIKAHLDSEMTFEMLVRQVTDTSFTAFRYSYYPFELLVEKICKDRYSFKNPLVNVTYSFQNFQDINTGVADNAGNNAPENDLGVAFYEHGRNTRTAKSDLHLTISENNDGLLFRFEYNTLLLKRDTIVLMENCLRNILLAINPVQVSTPKALEYEVV